MRKVKPKRLSKGDVIGVIAPASYPANPERIEKGVKYLEQLGYRVEVGTNVGQERGYLAGEDSQRLEDLHSMFKNKHVKAIFCVRGGYGAGRLLDKIDFNLIAKNPKIFVGYSDITVLQLAFYKKTGLVTFAGPMVAVDFVDEISPFTEEIFWKTITSNKKIGRLENPNDEKILAITKGSSMGTLLGGNLALIMSIFGTEFLPDFKNSILLIEDIGEAPYRVDRMFNQLKIAKIFKNIRGMILGDFIDCHEPDPDKKTLTLNEVIADYLQKLNIPVLYNLKHGHIKHNITIPFGVKCKINSTKKFIEITESAVS
ncbi:MAG: LD-carboxypeptidase [Ignavibacteriales bacterium]|nr:LD-carboxypeptidase [Ignavibacteriales bacterium]